MAAAVEWRIGHPSMPRCLHCGSSTAMTDVVAHLISHAAIAVWNMEKFSSRAPVQQVEIKMISNAVSRRDQDAPCIPGMRDQSGRS